MLDNNVPIQNYYQILNIANKIIFAIFQSVVGNIVAFRVHAPRSGTLLLDIFANAVTPREYLTGEPMKFKSVCKFRIACEELQTVMVPLPDCASGEWGPTKVFCAFYCYASLSAITFMFI